MLSEKPWRVDAVLILTAGLLLSTSMGGLIRSSLEHMLPKQALATQSFYTFLISTLSFQGVGLILMHFFIKVHGMTWKELLGGMVPQWRRALKWAVGAAVIAVPVTLGLNWVSAKLINWITTREAEQQMVMQVLQNTGGLGQRIAFGAAAILLAPVVEETLFRGILYPMIKQRGYPMLALSGTSLLFAAIHGSLLTFVPLTFFAMLLVLLYEETDALIAPIVTHSLFNALNFALFIFVPQK